MGNRHCGQHFALSIWSEAIIAMSVIVIYSQKLNYRIGAPSRFDQEPLLDTKHPERLPAFAAGVAHMNTSR